VEVEIDYTPRTQFAAFHERTERFAIGVAHRRAGKTVASINDLIRRVATCPHPSARGAYIAPLYNQAKDVAWSYLKQYAAPLLAKPPNEGELYVDLITGGRIRLYGADNPDRLRGIYLDEVVLDEYADMRPSVWGEVIRPLLADRTGRATFIGTPKGKNAFYKLFERSAADEDWFSFNLKASETGIIAASELAGARKDMSEDQYAQEFECSFEAAIKGAYYGKLLNAAEADGRIGPVSADPILQIRSFHDIGGAGAKSDAYTIWIAQWVGQSIRWLDYYEAQGQPLSIHAAWLRKRWPTALVVLPHDGLTAKGPEGDRYKDHWEAAGFDVDAIPNAGMGAAMQRIEAGRRLFPRMWFDANRTRVGRETLAEYHEQWDDKRDIGLGPDHNWASHCGDAFGVGCVVYEEPRKGVGRMEVNIGGVA
jgi:phage terminase large subunit